MLLTTVLCLAFVSTGYSQSQGYINVTIITSSLQTAANAYADVCIQNDTTTAVTLPFKDRSVCSCQTKTVTNSSLPVWQTSCSSNTIRYVNGSRVVVEVWNQSSTTMTTFLGGALLSIQTILANSNNAKQQTVTLSGGTATGNVILNVTWTPIANAVDNASATCIGIHHTDVDSASYLNAKCQLVCNIHNTLWYHNMSEALSCPEYAGTTKSDYMCRGGECVAPAKVGYIDIEIASGEVPNKSNAYADVCVQNDSSAVTYPTRNRSLCTCQTSVNESNAHPIWSYVCRNSSSNKWSDQARVTFEVFDRLSESITNFIGAVSVTIQQILAADNNHKQVSFPLMNSANTTQTGQIWIRITWTPA